MINGWTEQHPSVLERLNAGDRYIADGRRVSHGVRAPYRWFRGEMRERLPGSTGRTPIWMIAKPNLQRRRLCDSSCQTEYGYVCNGTHVTPGKTWMRLRLSSDRVLLSDFDRWDAMIRGEYVAENNDDAHDWDKRVRSALTIDALDPVPPFDSRWPRPLLEDIIRSWSRVFDTSKATTIQGSFEHLDLSDVRHIVHGPATGSTNLPGDTSATARCAPFDCSNVLLADVGRSASG